MKLAALVLTSALTATVWVPVAEAARLAVKGGGGTIVNDGTGDASNADLSASGDTDTLVDLGFTNLTLASDLGGLEILVSAFNLDPIAYPNANRALLTTLRVFFTATEPCDTSAGTCSDIDSVSEDGAFSDQLFYEGTNNLVNQTQQKVLASVELVPPPGTLLEFGTVYSYLLGDFVDEGALATLLAGATRQLNPALGFSLSEIHLGLAAKFTGVELLSDQTINDLQAPIDAEVATVASTVPEPGTLFLLGGGLLAAARARRRGNGDRLATRSDLRRPTR